MVDVAQYTNEVKRDSEHLVVIQKVKVCWTKFYSNKSNFVSRIFQVSILCVHLKSSDATIPAGSCYGLSFSDRVASHVVLPKSVKVEELLAS